jgi:predicted peroxiredoxin
VKPYWVVLLSTGELERLRHGAEMAAAAASMGLEVTVIWFDSALEALCGDALSSDEERSPGALLEAARETGRVRYLACSASAVATSGGVEKVRARVDEIVGWPTAVSLMRGAEKAFTI